MYDSCAMKEYFSFTEKFKVHTILYLSQQQKPFSFFLLKLSNSQAQILDQLGLFFYPHKLLFSFPTN